MIISLCIFHTPYGMLMRLLVYWKGAKTSLLLRPLFCRSMKNGKWLRTFGKPSLIYWRSVLLCLEVDFLLGWKCKGYWIENVKAFLLAQDQSIIPMGLWYIALHPRPEKKNAKTSRVCKASIVTLRLQKVILACNRSWFRTAVLPGWDYPWWGCFCHRFQVLNANPIQGQEREPWMITGNSVH